MRRGKCLNRKLAGKQIFLAGYLPTLAGQYFSGVITGWYYPVSSIAFFSFKDFAMGVD